MLGIIYRTWVLARQDEIQDDVEDRRVAETPSFDAEDDAEIPAGNLRVPGGDGYGRRPAARNGRPNTQPQKKNQAPRMWPQTQEGGAKVNIASLAPLAVVLPILGAALTFLLIRHSRAQRAVSIALLSLTLLLECLLLASVWDGGTAAVTIGGWLPPWGIVMVVDQFSSLMLVVSSAVSLAVLIYATGQGMADGDQDAPVSIFHPTYLILVAGVSNAFLSGDLFNLYVGFEILLTASYVLMTLGGTGPRIRAGVTYVVVSVVSSVLFLISIAMVYGATGTINMADLAIKLGELDQGTKTLLHVMLLVAFGIKAAVFPLSFWLPDSYPTAPAPVTAVFAGLLTKVGVYAMVRTETLLFPGDTLNTPLMVAALLTMVVGILGALAQSDIKRLLSFTLVSHIGYMVFGLAMSSVAGLGAAVFYVAHHITIQTSLFLVTGLIERRGGSSSVDRLGGLAKLSPLLALLFFVPAMNLAGIPPFSGFLGKLGLMQAGIELGTPLAYALVIGGVVTSLLTLLAIARVWNRAFWRKAHRRRAPGPRPAGHARGEGCRAGGEAQHRNAPAAHHGGLHAGTGGSRRRADGVRRAAVPGFRSGRPRHARQVCLYPGSPGRGHRGAHDPHEPEAENEPAPNFAAPGTPAPGLAGDRLGRPVAGLQPGQPPVRRPARRAVARLFYLPPVELSGRFNILRAAPFAVMFLAKVVVASCPGAVPGGDAGAQVKNAVVAVTAAEPPGPAGHRHRARHFPDSGLAGGGGGPVHLHPVPARPEHQLG
jgi:multicomponent Na+:H+ antiporter subunit D